MGKWVSDADFFDSQPHLMPFSGGCRYYDRGLHSVRTKDRFHIGRHFDRPTEMQLLRKKESLCRQGIQGTFIAEQICHITVPRQSPPMAIPFHFQTTQKLEVLQVQAGLDNRSKNHRPPSPRPGNAPTCEGCQLSPERLTDREGTDDGAVACEHSCGDCHVCCIHLPIPAGEVSTTIKPPGAICPRLTREGCGNYDQRPATCRQFQCAWLVERTWPVAWRPERSGLLCLREDIDNGVSAALVYEIAPGALARPTTQPMLEQLRKSTAVVAVVDCQKQRKLLRGCQWVDEGTHGVRRPHFLRPIQSLGPGDSDSLRDAS